MARNIINELTNKFNNNTNVINKIAAVEENRLNNFQQEVESIIEQESDRLLSETGNSNGTFEGVINSINSTIDKQNQTIQPNKSNKPSGQNVLGSEPKDAFYYLSLNNERNNLYTSGTELINKKNKSLYSGHWHTKETKYGLKAYAGASPVNLLFGSDLFSNELELRQKSQEEIALESIDFTDDELEIEYETSGMTDYWTSDAKISLNIKNGVPPYTIKWYRTDESGITTELKNLQNKTTITNLTYGTYTAEVTDLSQNDYQIDLRELDLNNQPSRTAANSVIDALLNGKPQNSLSTSGWEMYIAGIPYQGKYHLAEIPAGVSLNNAFNNQRGDG
jgi:hypothetical protein